jgi:hypothetical protein
MKVSWLCCRPRGLFPETVPFPENRDSPFSAITRAGKANLKAKPHDLLRDFGLTTLHGARNPFDV